LEEFASRWEKQTDTEPLLLDIVTTHADSNMRYVAAEALAKAGTPGSIKRLEQRLAVEPSVGVKGAS